jgi:hypothetical protein
MAFLGKTMTMMRTKLDTLLQAICFYGKRCVALKTEKCNGHPNLLKLGNPGRKVHGSSPGNELIGLQTLSVHVPVYHKDVGAAAAEEGRK